MRRHSERAPIRLPILFGLRTRLLAALVITAAVTLGVAALTLLAPLQSQLRKNTISLTEAQLSSVKADLGGLSPTPVRTYRLRLDARADKLDDFYRLFNMIVWRQRNGRIEEYVRADARRDPHASPALAVQAFAANGKAKFDEVDGELDVAARFRAHPTPAQLASRLKGTHYVVELFRPVDYVGQANSVVRSAFLDAALVGLGVAILLGIALSWRLVRRLRLLRDASLDERALGTLVVPAPVMARDEIGELASAFATMHARLRAQEDARRAFVATASHELRTPLASLDGMLELLADDLTREPIDLEDARIRVTAAQRQSRRLRGLASDLLDLSRLDAALELRSEPVELAETARAVAAEFDDRARERGVALALDEVNGHNWAQADPGSVAQIVRILLDNALHVAPTESMVHIRIGGSDGPAIEVADEGPGVPQEERELIFQRFQRGRQRGYEGGFGLGLAIGSELALRMGGRLELADAGPGATFRLSLPEVPA